MVELTGTAESGGSKAAPRVTWNERLESELTPHIPVDEVLLFSIGCSALMGVRSFNTAKGSSMDDEVRARR